MLSDATRLRALSLIDQEGSICVCELVYALELSQPKISRHLLALRDAGLVVSHRQAQWVFYTINPALASWQQQALAGALAGISSEAIVAQDKERLKEMKDRPQRAAA